MKQPTAFRDARRTRGAKAAELIPLCLWCGALVWPAQPAAAQSRPAGEPAEGQAADTRPAAGPAAPKAGAGAGRLTGDWGGLRTELEDLGFTFDLYYNHFYGVNTHGGRDTTNAQRNSGSVDLLVRLDFEKMGLIPGGEVLVFTKGHFSRNVNSKVGALSDPFDDADGDKAVYIDHLHYQQSLLDRNIQFRLGYLDQQLALDRNAYANSEDKQFMATYLDNNNAIIPLTIGMGASVFIDPTDWLGFVVGAADGDARLFRTGLDTAFHDGADFFGYFETVFRPRFRSRAGPLPGNYRFGLIYDPATRQVFKDDVDGMVPPRYQTGDVGFYVSFDQMVYRERPADGSLPAGRASLPAGDEQGLGLFFRYGFRHGEINRLNEFASAGAQYRGLLPGRNEDVLGFGFYTVRSSAEYRRWVDPDFLRETGYELYYNIQVNPWLTLTPDLQYVARPGGQRDTDDALVIGLRARVTF